MGEKKMPSTTTTVFDQLGGASAVSAAVDLLYNRLQSDAQLGRFFTGTDMPSLRRHMRMFLAGALGGPDIYRGRDLTAAHADLGISNDDFDHTAGHLIGVLNELQVPQGLIEDVMVNVGSLRPQIVDSAA
jgi:hemoglobin